MPAPSGYMWIGRNHENHSSKLPEMDWQLHDLHATGDNFKTYLIWSIWSDRAGCATRQVIRRWCRAPGQERPQGIAWHLVMDRKTGGPLQKGFCTHWYVLDVWLVHSLIVSLNIKNGLKPPRTCILSTCTDSWICSYLDIFDFFQDIRYNQIYVMWLICILFVFTCRSCFQWDRFRTKKDGPDARCQLRQGPHHRCLWPLAP